MTDLFKAYLGKLEVNIDGKTLDLDVRLKDKQKIMSLVSKFGKESIPEEKLNELADIFKEILKRSYPDTPEEEFDGFLLHKFEDFMTELSIAFGWTTKKELEKKIEEAKGKKLK